MIMKGMKICFIGVGSIAKRHIRNLHQIGLKRSVEFQIDAFRRNAVEIDGVDQIYTGQSDLPTDYDAIFITNPTDKHLEAMIQFQNNGKHFFIEKPVVSLPQIEAAYKYQMREGCVYYVACPLRYNAVIQYIKCNIDPIDVISVRCISSSYLPDWRPGQDYRKTYSAHKDMGGGVSIDLIHEWDYLTYLFGWPENVHRLIGRKSSLEIDSDDYAIYIAEFADKIGELHLDYFGRKTIREIMLFTREETILGDIVSNKIMFLRSGEVIDFHEERDDYQRRELEFFLDMVEGKIQKEDGYHHGLKVLELTQGRIL